MPTTSSALAAQRAPEGALRLLLLLATVGVLAVDQVGDVQHDVLTEVGRTVELAVLITDDDANLGVVAARSGLPGLQTDGEDRLHTLDLDALDERDGGDELVLVQLGDDVVGSLGEGDRHEIS